MSIEPTDVFAPAEGCEVSHTPDGFVLYQVSTEKVHYLNPTAAIIYELCGTGQHVSEMATYLQETFSLEEPPLADVVACLDNLVSEGLVTKC